jgi:hypothetical protein
MKPKPTKRKRKQKEDEIENDISHHFHLKHHEISHLVRSPLAAYQCILSLQ